MVAVLVMVVVMGMVVGNPFFVDFRTIVFLFYFYRESFWYRILFRMITTYVDLVREGFWLRNRLVGSSNVDFLRILWGRW